MVEPDSTRVVPTHAGAPSALASPHALQILTTEHWSLLAARSLGYTESMSRASIFIASLSGAVIALALVGQATEFGGGFVAFALVILPVVYFLGLSTVARLGQLNYEDALWVQGMNRIRSAYHEVAPELEPYFVTSRYDDHAGILVSALGTPGPLPRLQPLVGIPGVVSVIDSAVVGAIAGIAALGLDAGLGLSLAVGAAAFVCSVGLFVFWARQAIERYSAQLVPRFSSPESRAD